MSSKTGNTPLQEGRESMLEIYFPMSARILTVGHIKSLEWLTQYGFVTIGLLTSKAMSRYKDEIVPYYERKYILDTIAQAVEDVNVVPQESLNPAPNIRKYGCNALASGDGFEEIELKAIKELRLKRIDIKLRGERSKLYSSSTIINKIKSLT